MARGLRPVTSGARMCSFAPGVRHLVLPVIRAVKINRRRPTLPGPCGPSTIGAEGLNGSSEWEEVFPPRHSHRKLVETGLSRKRLSLALPGPSKPHSANEWISNIRQALDPLVPVSYECHHSSRSGLSTWWSTRDLTLSRRWENSSQGRLPA